MFKTFTTFFLSEARHRLWGVHKTSFFCNFDAAIGPEYYPVTTKMLNRINASIRKSQIVFHICDKRKLDRLINIQKSKKVISAFTRINSDKLYIIFTKGIESSGGVLVQLRGDVLLGKSHDIVSYVDAQNKSRRWVKQTHLHPGMVYQNEIRPTMNKLFKSILEKYRKKIDGLFDALDKPDNPHRDESNILRNKWEEYKKSGNLYSGDIVWSELIPRDYSKEQPIGKASAPKYSPWSETENIKKYYPEWGKIKHDMISDYIDALEQILKKYKSIILRFTANEKEKRLALKSYYNEVLVTNFKIEKIFLDTSTGMSEKRIDRFLKKYKKKYNIPVVLVNSAAGLLKHKEIRGVLT